MEIEVILAPAQIALLPGRDLSGTVCVVFDVLRATSTFVTALANGARRIYPVTSVEEALALRQGLPGALLGGERHGVRLAGFDLGNSPLEYTAEAVRGREIISTTTNGTVALRACAGADAVYAGALLNIGSLAAHLDATLDPAGRLLLVCAGTGTDFALEDGFGAGALLSRLRTATLPDDAGCALLALHAHACRDPGELLRASANGRRLQTLSLGADVDHCASVDLLEAVAAMGNGALERVI